MSDKSNSKFPEKADVVIVGVGGIVGSMLAYWLAELGQKNIVGLEKSTIIPSDIASTAHASDFVYNTCLLYTSPSPRDHQPSRMPSSA